MTDYHDLDAWKVARKLVKDVYVATRALPEDERFGLVSQMRRAAVSIPSNIAEGYGRGTRQEYIRYLRLARGSAAELETQVMLCDDLGYDLACPALRDNLTRCRQLLSGLLRSLQ
ncbi:MAG: four helix bundle protein [Armatimonadetes bacterium]|nr:four helix bundle protein [Armatimonadota bacterium]